jgi:hypothetical protein
MTVNYADAALAAARRYCGWVVTPPETITVTVDGPGGRVLSLKSLYLTAITAVIEDDVVLDVADLRFSRDTGVVYKKHGRCWSCHPGAITVTFTHGHDEAPDFDAAVEQAALALTVSAGRDDPAMTRKRVDDVEYDWSVSLLQGGALSGSAKALLDAYRILPIS